MTGESGTGTTASGTIPSGALLVTGIGELVTCAGPVGSTPTDDLTTSAADRIGIVREAAVVVVDGLVAWIGRASDAPAADRVVDVGGRAVIPGFVDSHSHLVYAGDRAAEFTARMSGVPYDGGGIGVSVAATRAASDDDLRTLLRARVAEMRALGTTTVEVKSGYGLTVDDEVRSLRLAAEVTDETTFLGAHVVPPEARDDRAAYLDLVCGPMLAACAPHARWVDAFCEPASPHAFTEDEARRVLTAGAEAGLGLRVHGNQLSAGPGVRLAVELGAASVDHCTFLTEADVDALVGAAGTTVATLLPGVEFSTRSPYPDARHLLDAGVDLAVATDCNPGTCNTASMPFVVALAVREMRLTAAEALVAATVGGARALRRTDIGRVAVGARADLAVLEAPSYEHLAYRPGMPLARALDW
ncbi:MAG TPA: imidazolonepropionase [Ornithinibacter sp.]|nr:imidazolonepropionase [Ornithinibacter sp.]